MHSYAEFNETRRVDVRDNEIGRTRSGRGGGGGGGRGRGRGGEGGGSVVVLIGAAGYVVFVVNVVATATTTPI